MILKVSTISCMIPGSYSIKKTILVQNKYIRKFRFYKSIPIEGFSPDCNVPKKCNRKILTVNPLFWLGI